jgi:thiopeptide-type bacteriocin biosynthesis protein
MRRLHLSGAAPPAAATPSGLFVMRTPLLPYDVLAAFGDALEAGATDPSGLVDALARDRARLRLRLREVVARPEVREAIFLASPGLEARLSAWERDPEGRRGAQIERALFGYVARMAGRPTPFGLFASVAVGAIGDRTELTLDERASYRRHTRLGIDYLAALADAIDRPEVRERVHVRVNPTLYRAAGRVRYTAAQRTATSRAYRLVAADVTPYLEATVARAARGARIADLARALVDDDPEIALEDAEGYVHALVDAQLLVSSIGPRVTGGEPTTDLLDGLRDHPELTGVAARLGDARDRLAAIDAGGPGAAPDRYRAIAQALDGPSAVARPSLFHVELARGACGMTLGREPVTEILRGVEILRRLSRPSRSLRRFVEVFAARYGDAELPLLEALDDESGVGFDAPAGGAVAVPLLQGLRISSEPPVAQLTARDALLLRKVEQARRNGQPSLDLSLDELLRPGHEDALPLPPAFHVVARIAARSPQALACGDFTVVLESAAAPSGADLLAACRGDDALLARLSEHLRAEEAVHPGAVFAELVVLPETGTGDLMVRPVLRDHEIVILGRSGAPEDRQIPVSDLVVSIDRAERIVVRSLRLGREVIPRMTAPVDAKAAEIGVVRFLCALQHQGTATDLAFRWGPLEALAVLPRVQAGRVILARARWRLFADALHGLATPGAGRFRAVQRLREQLEIPRHVEIGESGRWLPLDLDSALCVEVLGRAARQRPDVVVREQVPAFEELCATGPDGRFVHELVIPFLRDDRTPIASEPATPPARIARRFAPGSEWLQADIHTGLGSADRVITELVRLWVTDALVSGAADRWFFLRYADQGARLRVRIHGDPARLMGEVFPALQAGAAAFAPGVIWNVALDTYQRETERFGGPHGIEIAEHMFHADSDAVAAILEHLEGDAGEIARWQLTLRGIDLLLDDLGLDRRAKLAVMRAGKAKLAGMLHASPGLDRQLGAAYRTQRAALEALLAPASDPTGDLAAPLAVLQGRSTRLAPWVHELRGRERAGQLTQPIAELAWSFVHMFTNRMLRSASLAQELVLYDWLRRIYRSALARERR